ncbi:glycosyltransferase [Thetidibacter halocola]|uniref:Glycosyltransferase n=1 Tax=Thetidibacter halocola TaxID=2827239 RepID=A0A8J7WJ45_9RHOB|nr:glycosyltransferase [Thetidibacter halocola]MBS0126233.1 glycosyltransferase [Thetidibacter halocola]
MRLLILTHWLSNRGGGVSVVAAAHARALAAMPGIEVHAMGLVSDPGERADQDWGGATVHALIPRDTRLTGHAPGMVRAIEAIAPDVVHLHGLWTYPALLAGRWRARHPGGRLVISPHGMLTPCALAQSAWKKALAGLLFQRRTFARADLLHALSASETTEIRAYCGARLVAEIPNGVDLAPVPPRAERPEPRRMLYLGRIHPGKNLDGLLEAWAHAGPLAAGWTLQVAGWDQGGTEARLRAQVARLGLADRVTFSGPLFGTNKDAALAAADAFVLPSLSEGLPMAVLEAWSHALPVLMTEACNLPHGFAEGAARRLDTADVAQAARALADFLAMDAATLARMGAAGRALAERDHRWDVVAQRFRAAYDWSRGETERPDFIRDYS